MPPRAFERMLGGRVSSTYGGTGGLLTDRGSALAAGAARGSRPRRPSATAAFFAAWSPCAPAAAAAADAADAADARVHLCTPMRLALAATRHLLAHAGAAAAGRPLR